MARAIERKQERERAIERKKERESDRKKAIEDIRILNLLYIPTVLFNPYVLSFTCT